MRDDFAIFIMSYNRPKNIATLRTLEKAKYSGKYYVIVGDDDPQLSVYQDIYGDKVRVFNKQNIENSFDIYDNGGSNKCIVYARNYCFKLAQKLGLKYFAQFDDDYIELAYRYPQNGKLKICNIKEFDKIVDICIDFLEDTGALTIAFAQHGDFIGGVQNKFLQDRVRRKAMNSFFCKTDNPFTFDGRINEDVNAYVGHGRTGKLFLTFCDVSLKQKHTQQNKGGMTDIYTDGGTYLKSFYTVIANPSCVKVSVMGDKYLRMHHRVSWNHAVPKIISDRYKK